MIQRYLPLVLAAIVAACAKSRQGQGAADSTAVPASSADAGTPPSPPPESAAVPESAATTATPESAVSAATRHPARPDSAKAPTARDSMIESRRHLPKGAKTDTGYHPPTMTPRDSGAGRDTTPPRH